MQIFIAGTSVMTLAATDGDSLPNNIQITYSIDSKYNMHVSITF